MARYIWDAIEGEFRVQVDIGGLRTDLVLDTGFTSSACSIGLYVSRTTYQRLDGMGAVSEHYSCEFTLADGRTDITTVGLVEAQLVHDSRRIGPRINTLVVDGGDNSEELVGTCFFHRMAAGILIWDFADQTVTLDINDG